MRTPRQRLREIIASVQLLDVRLREVAAVGSPPKGKMMMSVVVGHSARVTDKTAQGFDVAAEIAVRAVAAEGRRKSAGSRRTPTMLSIRATFDLRYQLSKIAECSRQDLTQFANVNGVYNAWPYWRELIQSVSVRMGLPPLTLPVFRIPQPGRQTDRPKARRPRQKRMR